MTYLIVSGKSIRQERAEWDARLNDRSTSKPSLTAIPSRADPKAGAVTKTISSVYSSRNSKGMFAAIEKNPQTVELFRTLYSNPAAKQDMMQYLSVDAAGRLGFSGENQQEIDNKVNAILTLFKVYQPNNGLQGYGDDPNRSGQRDPNKAPAGWVDPNISGAPMPRKEPASRNASVAGRFEIDSTLAPKVVEALQGEVQKYRDRMEKKVHAYEVSMLGTYEARRKLAEGS